MMIRFFKFILPALLISSVVHAEPALTKVNQTQTLRCGYIEYAPALTRDMESGIWSGFNADVMKLVADRLELKLEWAAPSGWATVIADLNAKKFDMFCTGYWVHPNMGKFSLFSRPFFFQPVFVVARAADPRFAKLPDLNDETLTMAALEGDNPVNIAAADFPQAKVMALSNVTDFSQVLVTVATKKADFTLVDAYTFGAYNKHNPGKLKIVNADKPVRVYPVSFVFGSEDIVLRDAVNAALDELILDGSMDRIFDTYDDYPNAFYRAEVPHRRK